MYLWYFPQGVGWVGEINNKEHLSPAEVGCCAELGNSSSLSRYVYDQSLKLGCAGRV